MNGRDKIDTISVGILHRNKQRMSFHYLPFILLESISKIIQMRLCRMIEKPEISGEDEFYKSCFQWIGEQSTTCISELEKDFYNYLRTVHKIRFPMKEAEQLRNFYPKVYENFSEFFHYLLEDVKIHSGPIIDPFLQ
jgi:hypothetical protein